MRVRKAVLGSVVGARLLATARREDRLAPLGLDRLDQGAAVIALVSQHVARWRVPRAEPGPGPG